MYRSNLPVNLTELAKQNMLERHLLPDFPATAIHQADQINAPAQPSSQEVRDMRNLLWFSLDNDESRDLDQVTYAEKTSENTFKMYVAIADVDSLVKKDTPIDLYAQQNTTSIYTPTKVFPMLPVKLSTNLTSLNEDEDRMAIIMETEIDLEGSLKHYSVYQGYIRNKAKLAYNSISEWLDGVSPPPEKIKNNQKLDSQVRLQDQIATILRQYRHQKGALTLQTIEPLTIFSGDEIIDLRPIPKSRGRNLIEDFMISANQTTAFFLRDHKQASLRRVVRTPKLWDRIVEIANEYGTKLPLNPDALALEQFLKERYSADPLHFPDLSLTIIKLLGNGEYVVEYPGQAPIGHFGLAVKNYTHSTAPNRRFPDLITQRVIKATLDNHSSPYTNHELEKFAKQCTEKEDEADKVERQMKKSAACVLLSSKLNEEFDALVTGASLKGTWVRLLTPPVDGKLIQGFEGLKVGDKIRVQLINVDILKGFIDFIRVYE